MARSCDICGRGPHRVVRRSHAMNKTLSPQNLNLQQRTVNGKKVKICTTCLKGKHYSAAGAQKMSN